MHIDCDFPGGNIIVEKIEGDTAFIKQDLRDTAGHWFYWYFRAAGAAGQTVKFQFTSGNVIGTRGPCVSTDGGKTWAFHGRERVQDLAFTYIFPASASEVRFCVGIPYLDADLQAFLEARRGHPNLKIEPLCADRRGRNIEKLALGNLSGTGKAKVFFTARHHCCESTPSFTVEGIVDTILGADALGAWCRKNIEFLIVPMVDKDGVEDGDQGKNRKPYDHNRDYLGNPSIYPAVRAIRDLIPGWSQEKMRVALDLHCPGLRGKFHEDIYFVGSQNQEHWARVTELSKLLEQVRTGPLPYYEKDNLPYGVDWNVDKEPHLMSCSKWMRQLPGVWIANGVEIPYAACEGVEVTPDRARAFGRDLLMALKAYLEPRI